MKNKHQRDLEIQTQSHLEETQSLQEQVLHLSTYLLFVNSIKINVYRLILKMKIYVKKIPKFVPLR